EHHFVFICDEHVRNSFKDYNNIDYEASKLQKKNTAQWYIWYRIKLPAILKKYKVNVLLTYDMASAGKVPQCLFIPHLSFIRQPFLYKKSHQLFYKKFLPRSIKKASAIITSSQFCKDDIIERFNAEANKVEVIYSGVENKCRNISYEERERIKSKNSEGNEYFIYVGEIGSHRNLLNLLKAFSAFKKRQKSNMQLFIAGPETYKYKNFYEDIRLFKFKEDVKIYSDASANELIDLVAASYALINPSQHQWYVAPLLTAMKVGVPVIASDKGPMPEILADAALYADPENFKEFAIKMMSLFRDENLRSALIERGKAQVEKYSWDAAAGVVWETINKII
ncbi:MAG: glycosyltransferase family 4 protein, partial [Bacteroidota bacterium]|nr:glycosyltransferase family 4 protein [Bacteroidota bacterium]